MSLIKMPTLLWKVILLEFSVSGEWKYRNAMS